MTVKESLRNMGKYQSENKVYNVLMALTCDPTKFLKYSKTGLARRIKQSENLSQIR